MEKKCVIVLDIPGLGLRDVNGWRGQMPHVADLIGSGRLHEMTPVFPALTVPAQATITTGAPPSVHGMVFNGIFLRDEYRASFWEQADSLVGAERVWERLKSIRPGLKCAVLFFQNTLYARCDAVMTPRPLHTHDGLIQWCYSKPPGLYEDVSTDIGPFNLFSYWGPGASMESTDWIARAAIEVVERVEPDLLFVYLPHLDYCCQRMGPDYPGLGAELSALDRQVGGLMEGVRSLGVKASYMLLSEYAFSPVAGDIPLNLFLRHEGLLKLRRINGREYPDIELSAAFAVADHQIAHLYVKSGYVEETARLLDRIKGIDLVLDAKGKREFGVDHPRSGELVAVSARDRWFSYGWWEDKSFAPDYAWTVDIHRKPGYDPLELFPGERRGLIASDASLVKGSHGRPPLGPGDLVPLILAGKAFSNVAWKDGAGMEEIPSVLETVFS